VCEFALPPLVLQAVRSGDVVPLLHWWRIRSRNTRPVSKGMAAGAPHAEWRLPSGGCRVTAAE
jgi:hypothetical protein